MATGAQDAVVFFDIGDTSGSVRVDARGRRIEDMAVLAGALGALIALHAGGVPMGVISNRGSSQRTRSSRRWSARGLLENVRPVERFRSNRS
jgi:hypothetical protein